MQATSIHPADYSSPAPDDPLFWLHYAIERTVYALQLHELAKSMPSYPSLALYSGSLLEEIEAQRCWERYCGRPAEMFL